MMRAGLPYLLIFAVVLAVFAFYDIAWGFDDIGLASCISGSGTKTVYSPPSSSSVSTLLSVQSLTLSSATASVSCGPLSTIAIAGQYSDFGGYVSCTGYSLKLRSGGTGGACLTYIEGTPAPYPTMTVSVDVGDISVDTSGVESVLKSIGMIGLVSLFLYGLGMGHHILSKV